MMPGQGHYSKEGKHAARVRGRSNCLSSSAEPAEPIASASTRRRALLLNGRCARSRRHAKKSIDRNFFTSSGNFWKKAPVFCIENQTDVKIIALNASDEALIKKALKRDAAAEQKLYERYAPKMLSVCRYYIKDLHYAEDVLVTGFTKVFDKLDRFRFEGSFEGWIRRIMVREALDFLRSRQQMPFSDLEVAEVQPAMADDSDFDAELLQLLIDELPTGYRTVLLLYAVEGYNHKEIGEMLGISENTSKTQLFKARKALQERLSETKRKEHGAG